MTARPHPSSFNLDAFIEKFELFAEVPNAVGKIRELVLQLAVQGRLVPQDTNDESPAVTFKKLAKSALESSDADFPAHWLRVPLGKLGEWRGGGTPSKSQPDFWKGDIPWVSPKDMKSLQIADAQDHISNAAVAGSSVRLIPKGGLLMVVRGMILARSFPVGVTTVEVTINQDMKALLPAERNTTGFLLLALRALESKVLAVIERSTHGTCKLETEVLHAFAMPIPPLAEQKRIVAKVDELMALCDRLEAQQQERDNRHAAIARAALARFAEAPTPANLEFLFHLSYAITPAELRKAILSLAVQGKLAHQDPNDIAVDESIKTARLKAHLPVCPPDSLAADDAPFEIPSTWRWVTVGDVAETRLGKMLDKEKNRGEPHPYLRNTNVHWFRFELESIKTMLFEQSELAEYRIDRGDVLICEGGHGIARSAVWNGQIPGIMFQKALHRVRPLACLNGHFLTYALWVYESEGILQRYYTGAGIPHFTGKSLARVVFPLPPLAEQHRIVAKVDQLMAMVDRLEVQLAEAKAKSAALLDAVIYELLNPSAEIVDLAAYRAAIGCYAIRKMSSKRYFGRTAAMKAFYLAQAHVGLELGLHPMREAAGPLDPWLYRFEEEGERQGWFKVVESTTGGGKKKIEYLPGQGLAEQSSQAERFLSARQRKEFDRLFGLLADKKTEEAEIIATLFAAWNDFLIDGHTPSDDEIVTEVREHWHEAKRRFTPALLQQWLTWLRLNDLVPSGRLPRTVHQPQLLLN